MHAKETKNLEAGATTSREKSQTERKDGRTSYSRTYKQESSRKSSRSKGAKAKGTTRKGKLTSASKPKVYTQEQVTELIHKRVNTINRKNGENTLKYREKISELERRNEKLYDLLKEMIDNDGQANASKSRYGARPRVYNRRGARTNARAARRAIGRGN